MRFYSLLKTLLNKGEIPRTVKLISLVYIGEVISKIFLVLTTIILIRSFSESEYATFIIFTSVASVLMSLIGSGLNSALVRFSSEELSVTDNKPYSIYLSTFLIEILLYFTFSSLIYFNASKVSEILFGNASYSDIIPISLLFGFGSLLLGFGKSILKSEQRFSLYSFILSVVSFVFFIFIGILSIWSEIALRTVALGYSIIYLFFGFIIIIICFKEIGSQKKLRLNFKTEGISFSKYISASIWLIGYYVVLAVFSRLDVLLLSRLSSETELANYGVAFRYYSIALIMLNSIHAVLGPKFSRIEMHDIRKQSIFLTKWIKFSSWISLPLIIFAFFGKDLYLKINGFRYENSFEILIILSIGIWSSVVFSPLINILRSRKEFSFMFYISVLAFIIGITSHIILISNFGGIGAAISTILSIGLINIGSAVKIHMQDRNYQESYEEV